MLFIFLIEDVYYGVYYWCWYMFVVEYFVFGFGEFLCENMGEGEFQYDDGGGVVWCESVGQCFGVFFFGEIGCDWFEFGEFEYFFV